VVFEVIFMQIVLSKRAGLYYISAHAGLIQRRLKDTLCIRCSVTPLMPA